MWWETVKHGSERREGETPSTYSTKEKALSAIKTSYLNSYKVIVAGARDFADYAFMKKKT